LVNSLLLIQTPYDALSGNSALQDARLYPLYVIDQCHLTAKMRKVHFGLSDDDDNDDDDIKLYLNEIFKTATSPLVVHVGEK